MINNPSEKIYKIVLPSATVNDVVEWFDQMEEKGLLTTSLIELVYEKVNKGNSLSGIPDSIVNLHEEPLHNLKFDPNDFFNNLYDCSGSNAECFEEKTANKKEKKKMFYI